MFPASAILSLGDDAEVGQNLFNFWLAENGKSGADQGFILDLGCAKLALGVRIKNAQNRNYRDRGTKKFRLLSSKSSPSGPWKTILEGDLDDIELKKVQPIKQLTFETPAVARFVKFELLEFWGKGGGLQYFAVLTTDDKGGNFNISLERDMYDY